MARYPFVAIEGAIGVGKTTLARLLEPALNGAVVLEVFEENPFLSDFYADRARYAFQTQIFFLLSRYRQQIGAIPETLQRSPIISDYTFAKDRLFAHLNLKGDELEMYERVHAALGEKIPQPDLLVYLRADLDVLMGRIAARDRPYERNMDPNYIEQLRQAYEEFATVYDQAPVLPIDTNNLDIVQNPDDREHIVSRIKSSLAYGTYQAQLPGVEATPQLMLEELKTGPHRLSDFQQFHVSLDADKNFDTDMFINFILLNEEMGELAHALTGIWKERARLQTSGLQTEDAYRKALETYRDRMRDELADCLAYLLKLSNYAKIDLEEAYLEKMSINADRIWESGKANEEGTDGH